MNKQEAEWAAAELRALTEYSPYTGQMTWLPRSADGAARPSRVKTWNSRYAGMPVGRVGSDGYITANVFRRAYKVHRLIWLYMTGDWPEGQIDHINQDKADNRWVNLRDVSQAENARNAKLHIHNKTGISGVRWSSRDKCYFASIGGKSCGTTKDFFQACCLRKSAENRLGYHPNHGKAL